MARGELLQIVVPVLGISAGTGLIVYGLTRGVAGSPPPPPPPPQCPPNYVWDGTKCVPIIQPPAYQVPALPLSPGDYIDAQQTLISFVWDAGVPEVLAVGVRFNKWARIQVVDVRVHHRAGSSGSVNILFWGTDGGLYEVGKMWQLDPFATQLSGSFQTQGQLTGGVILASYLWPVGYITGPAGTALLQV